MFWDKVSPLYDLFEEIYNGKVYSGTGAKVAEFIGPSDTVLECACGTGAISIFIAPKCRRLIATDFAAGMLRQAAKKCRMFPNVVFRKADITHLKCKDGRFDKVVAGNVIHLLPNPEQAMQELAQIFIASAPLSMFMQVTTNASLLAPLTVRTSMMPRGQAF